MKKPSYKNKKKKHSITNFFPLFIFIITLFLSVGYAVTGSINFKIRGSVLAHIPDGVFIGDVSFNEEESRNVNKLDNSYIMSGTFLNSFVELGSAEDSRLVYDITIYNNTEEDLGFKEIISEVNNSLNVNNNSNIEFETTLNHGALLERKDTISFTLTFKYVDNVVLDTNIPDYNKVNSLITFSFGEEYLIDYFFYTGNYELQKTVLENDNLVIDFPESVRPDNVFIQMSENELTINEDFTYNSGHLEVTNVTGNIRITTNNHFVNGYRKIKYIESNKSQYIDTGIVGKSGVSSEIGFEALNNGDYTVLGARANSTRIYLSHIYNGQTLGYGSFYTNTTFDTGYHVVKTSLKQGSQTMFVDDTQVYNQTNSSNINTNLNMYAFALNFNGSPMYHAYIRLYYMKIYEYNETTNKDELVRDFIPVVNENTGENGLYDVLNGNFYKSENDIKFIINKKNDIDNNKVLTPPLPSEYKKIYYIESSGTQYIDTGVIAKTGLSSEIYVKILQDGDFTISGVRKNNERLYLLHYYHRYTLGYNGYYQSEVSDIDYYKFNTVLKNRNQILKMNDEVILTKSINQNLNLDATIFIFGSNNGYGNLTYPGSMRIYNMKIWEENNDGVDVLVRNFVPCYRKSDHEYGLYDLVTEIFYENQGTGSFIGGAE